MILHIALIYFLPQTQDEFVSSEYLADEGYFILSNEGNVESDEEQVEVEEGQVEVDEGQVEVDEGQAEVDEGQVGLNEE